MNDWHYKTFIIRPGEDGGWVLSKTKEGLSQIIWHFDYIEQAINEANFRYENGVEYVK